MKLIFIRHAKDDNKYRGGWSNQDINFEGMKQSSVLAEYLEENKEIFKIKKFIISDLKRVVSTTNIINEKLKSPVETDVRLREINNGLLAGMLNEEALIKYPGLFFNTLEIDQKYPNGESPIEFYNRIVSWFNEVLKIYTKDDKNIAIVTHAGVINVIYFIVKKLQWSNSVKSFKISNCSIHVLDLTSMKFEVENNIDYLT